MMTAHSTNETLAEVPQTVFMSPRNVTENQRWRQCYNVAVWVRFKQPTGDRVCIFLRIEDSQGQRDILVDKAEITSAVVLLSARVTLKLIGPMRSMSVILNSPVPVYRTDELFIQPVKGALENRKLVGV